MAGATSLCRIMAVTFLLAVRHGAMGKQCDYYSKCACIFDDGTGMVDLSSLARTDGVPQ